MWPLLEYSKLVTNMTDMSLSYYIYHLWIVQLTWLLKIHCKSITWGCGWKSEAGWMIINKRWLIDSDAWMMTDNRGWMTYTCLLTTDCSIWITDDGCQEEILPKYWLITDGFWIVPDNQMKLPCSTDLGHDPHLWLPPVNFYVELIWL